MTDNREVESHETRIAKLEQQCRYNNFRLWILVAFLLGAQFSSGWTFWQFLFATIAAASLVVFIMRRSPKFSLDRLFGLSEQTNND